MISLTWRTLFGILGGDLLRSLSPVRSGSVGLGVLCPMPRCPRSRAGGGPWEPDGKPGSLVLGAWFVGRFCCGPILTGGTVGGRRVVWGPDGKPGPWCGHRRCLSD